MSVTTGQTGVALKRGSRAPVPTSPLVAPVSLSSGEGRVTEGRLNWTLKTVPTGRHESYPSPVQPLLPTTVLSSYGSKRLTPWTRLGRVPGPDEVQFDLPSGSRVKESWSSPATDLGEGWKRTYPLRSVLSFVTTGVPSS